VLEEFEMLPGSVAFTNLQWLLVAGHLPITTSLSPTGLSDSWIPGLLFLGAEGGTHTHIPLLDIGVRAYMIKQALHVGVSKGQNPKHESNSLKVCFKLGKPALSCRQLPTK
jgi:hypothetical protein